MNDLLPVWPPNWPEIAASVQSVLDAGDWGRYRSEIKTELIDHLRAAFGVSHVWPTSSGTAAIEISLRAAGVGTGDRVVVAAYDYPGNFRTIELLNARPVLADINAERYSLCPDSLRAVAQKIPAETIKAVVFSHLYGQPADVRSIRELCDQHQWVMIEDACQVPGMTIDGRPAGSFGDLATLSFGGSKPLTCGNGGAVLTSSPKFQSRLSGLLERPSETFPLSALQAAVLMPQLDRLAETVKHRCRIARKLAERLPDLVQHQDHDGVQPSFYKLALSRIVTNDSLPIGVGFRSMHRSSERRCDKPVELSSSESLAESCHVLDHRALLIDETQVDWLLREMMSLS